MKKGICSLGVRAAFAIIFLALCVLSGAGCAAGVGSVLNLRTELNRNKEAGTTGEITGQTDKILVMSAEEGSEGGDDKEYARSGREESETKNESESETIAVYLCGYVNSPGVCFLEKGARLFEAVEAAGGLSEGASEWRVNLAAEVNDGSMVYIPGSGEDDALKQDQALLAASGGTGGKVNLNTAGKTELMNLPGIGEAKAEAIIEYRDREGHFTAPEDIMKVPGIKEGAFEKLREYISV